MIALLIIIAAALIGGLGAIVYTLGKALFYLREIAGCVSDIRVQYPPVQRRQP